MPDESFLGNACFSPLTVKRMTAHGRRWDAYSEVNVNPTCDGTAWCSAHADCSCSGLCQRTRNSQRSPWIFGCQGCQQDSNQLP